MSKEWHFRELPKDCPISVDTICTRLQISPFLAGILLRRGFQTLEELHQYLTPSVSLLTPPDRWPSVPETAELLTRELLKGKKITIWGDYDVDGITATALCLDVLEHYGINATFYLPNRNTEGYGLNIQGIEALAREGTAILLTVDCGISNVDAVLRAKELGMTVVISDHHIPPETCPGADALCDPKILPRETLPCPDLAGVGVAFYLMAQVNILLARAFRRPKFCMDRVLDLVALGTLADLMPLTGENRRLVAGGLVHIRKARRLGIAALEMITGSNIATEIRSGEINFKLVPRLNAAGRIEHAKSALTLLRTQDHEEALQLANHLDQLNHIRRDEEERILAEARLQAEEYLGTYRTSLVLYAPNWHPGVIGIVASRIVDEFGKPTFVLCRTQDRLKGSGRSVGDINIHSVLTEVQEYLTTFGGHKAAAAMTITEENLEPFRAAFDAAVEKASQSHSLTQRLFIDGELSLRDAFCSRTLEEISLMEPFGQKNPAPVFVSPVLVCERHDAIGHDRKNILLVVRDTTTNMSMPAKGWRLGSDYPPPSLAGKKLRLAYSLHLSTFRGIPQPELDIKDIRVLSA